MSALLLLLASLSSLHVVGRCASSRTISALSTDVPGQYDIVDGLWVNGVVIASFNNTINETGWSFLEIHDNRGERNISDEEVAFLAGKMESNLTASLMEMQWRNTMDTYCSHDSQLCQKVMDFILENSVYTASKSSTNPTWYQVKLMEAQLAGLIGGYVDLGLNLLPNYAFKFFQLHGEIDDLASAFEAANSSARFKGRHRHDNRTIGSGSCSAIVKLLPDNSDLLIGHNTWTSYANMLRIFKLYNLRYQRSSEDKTTVPGRVQAFPSYPGRLYSGDDFYLLSSGLVTMETSIENTNPDLWKFVTPECIFENVRVMVANRLATSGKTWTDIFKAENSGTYNNQWMVVDYKTFVKGKLPRSGLLWVLEQMPNYIVAEDQTSKLKSESYWASYNIPFYPEIFNISGTGKLAKQYGDWFTWDGAPRAKIFARNHTDVTDLQSLISLMQYNDFQHDDLAACKCKPPYSGENGIAARSDLNPANGKYPFSALGHRLHGAIDMKVTSSELFKQQLSCQASSGPTFAQQPPFQWSTSNSTSVPLGHPDKWDFDSLPVTWFYN